MEIPISTIQSATAASYTIPSDRYAIIRAQVKAGGTLSIGGIVVLGSDTWNAIASNASPITITQSGVLGPGLSIPMNSGTSPALSQATSFGSTGGGSPLSSSGATFTNSSARTSDAQTFKVPPGTVIVGTGDARYFIELYKIPGSAT